MIGITTNCCQNKAGYHLGIRNSYYTLSVIFVATTLFFLLPLSIQRALGMLTIHVSSQVITNTRMASWRCVRSVFTPIAHPIHLFTTQLMDNLEKDSKTTSARG